jgi:hypothetical protein
MDRVLWDLAKSYHEEWLQDNPDNPGDEKSLNITIIGMLCGFGLNGDVTRTDHTDGSATWKATAQFLREMNLERGPLVTREIPQLKPENQHVQQVKR